MGYILVAIGTFFFTCLLVRPDFRTGVLRFLASLGGKNQPGSSAEKQPGKQGHFRISFGNRPNPRRDRVEPPSEDQPPPARPKGSQ